MPFKQTADPRVTRSLTLGKLIRCHEGVEVGRAQNNQTVEGIVSVTSTEVTPGSMTDQELYDDAEALLSESVNRQFEENSSLLQMLVQSKA